MLTIHADVQQTRRKKFHHVVDADGETILYSSRSLLQCIEWVIDNGEIPFAIEGPLGYRNILTLCNGD